MSLVLSSDRTNNLPRLNNTSKALDVDGHMPQKDLTSDGSSGFSMGRRAYRKTTWSMTDVILAKTNGASARINGIPRTQQFGANAQQKKWFNTNRSASQIVENRRKQAFSV